MNTLLWAGLAANALVQLRVGILEIQDEVDRVKAGVLKSSEAWQWNTEASVYLFARVAVSPVITVYKAAKFLMFPRGVKSKFTRQQEAKAKADALAEEMLQRAEREAIEYKEQAALVATWAPGEILLAAPEPEQVALNWDHAANVFDNWCDHVAATAGQPWKPTPPKKRVRATVGSAQ